MFSIKAGTWNCLVKREENSWLKFAMRILCFEKKSSLTQENGNSIYNFRMIMMQSKLKEPYTVCKK